ncbi:Hydrogen peroxide stress regulator 1 [Pleurostoma richardsiae]|uniref:Hydrogen peroxide stress regulator 1 n=1 Tax=Pleurostoma richardsiae TaxID=41990 RepID=A0AA38VZL5_9PEZI|nr:Hydrogen peroxide stress regulator 1 [Pleurostoma richardsiae]
MDYQQFSLLVAPYALHLSEDQTYEGLQMPGSDEAVFSRNVSNLDPSLAGFALPEQCTGHWNQPPLQRFLKEQQKLAIFNPVHQLPAMTSTSLVRPIAPVPPASQGRPGSPVSSHEPTSSSSGPQSPPGDSEFLSDHIPSTPPDLAFFTPFGTSQLDQWGADVPFCDLTGGTAFSDEAGVSMAEVMPEPSFESFDQESTIEFMFPSRASTWETQMSSHSSQLDMTTTTSQTLTDFNIKRMASPEDLGPVIEDEIYIGQPAPSKKNTKSQYPPIDPDDDDSSVDEPEIVLPKEEDDDGEYKPGKKPSRPPPASSKKKNAKEKRSAPSRLEKPSLKRQRTGGGGGGGGGGGSSSSSHHRHAKMLPPPPSGVKGGGPCPECAMHFKDAAALDAHVKKQHTRPFVCVFSFAGCTSTFASKNEWKRHVSSQHLLLHFWLCTEGACAQNKNGGTPPASPSLPSSSSGKSAGARGKVGAAAAAAAAAASASSNRNASSPALPNGAIFNRKDLYTQHLRRMHTPPHIKKATRHGKKGAAPPAAAAAAAASTPEWDEHIRALQQSALRERCRLPPHMACPAAGCAQQFNGPDAWDLRMEHVARHLERAAAGAEPAVVFGGGGDPTLMAWATRGDVAVVRMAAGGGAWEMNNPLRRETGRGEIAVAVGGGKAAKGKEDEDEDEEATAVVAEVVVKNEIVVESGGEEDAEGEEEEE